jgi:hypothetical protein
VGARRLDGRLRPREPARTAVHEGRQIDAGEATDPRDLFDWLEHPDPNCDLSSTNAVRAAVEVAYRGAGEHVDLEQIVARFYEIPEFEWRCYYLNQFTATAEMWLPTGAWARCADTRRVVAKNEKVKVVLGFDGSYNNDSTALVGCTLDGHVFVVAVWEKPQGSRGDGWVVPREEVTATVDRAMRDYDVQVLACDPPGWHREIDEWSERYAKAITVMYPTNRRTLMSDAQPRGVFGAAWAPPDCCERCGRPNV